MLHLLMAIFLFSGPIQVQADPLNVLYPQAEKLYIAKDLRKAISQMMLDLKQAKKTRNPAQISSILHNIGVSYEDLGKRKLALDFFEEAAADHNALIDIGNPNYDLAIVNLNSRCGLYRQFSLMEKLKSCAPEREAILKRRNVLYSGQAMATLDISTGTSGRDAFFRNDLLQEGEKLESSGAQERFLGHIPEALKNYRDAWSDYLKAGNKVKEASCLAAMARIYLGAGQTENAILAYNRAIKLHGEIKDTKNELTERLEMALIVQESGDKNGSRKVWFSYLSACARGNFTPGVIDALSSIARIDATLGRDEEAIQASKKAALMAREDGKKRQLISILDTSAGIRSLDYASAIKDLNEAVTVADQSDDKNSEIESLNALAFKKTFLGDFSSALKDAWRALDLAQRIKDRIKIASTHHILGVIYDEIGDSERALAHDKKSYQLAVEVPDLNLASEDINEMALSTGSEQQTIADYQESLRLRYWGGTVINLGYAYWAAQDYKKALQIFKSVDNQLGIGHYDLIRNRYPLALKIFKNQLARMDNVRDYSSLLALYSALGLTYEGMKRYRTAADYYRKGENLMERIRSGLEENERLPFIAGEDWAFKRLASHKGMVRISQFLKSGLRGALYAAEFTHSRIFAEEAARRYGSPETRIPISISQDENRMNEVVASAEKRAEDAFAGNNEQVYDQALAELKTVKAAQNYFIERLRQNYPEYASVMYPQPVYVEDIPLKSGEAIIEYEVTGPYSKAFVIRNGRIVLSYDIPLRRNTLEYLVKKYCGFFKNIRNTADLSRYDPSIGKRLYDLLLKPALSILPKSSKIIIVPDEILGILPFDSLVSSQPKRLQFPANRYGPVPVGVRYVADDWDIAYAQSSTALTLQRRFKKRGETTRGLLVLADPVFNVADSRLKGTPLAKEVFDSAQIRVMGAVVQSMGFGGSRKGLSDVKKVGRENFTFPRLDETGILADVLSKKIFAGTSATVLTGLSASKSELNKLDLSRYRYLVFATHGILGDSVPWIREPALVLTQVGLKNPEDGFLSMSEIMGLKLNVEAAALTACQTGLGRYAAGEGVMGLGRAFQYAGARNVLVSLWNVNEKSTTLLASRFFKYLKKGKSERQALMLARTDVRRQGYEHPFYWAPFILVSD